MAGRNGHTHQEQTETSQYQKPHVTTPLEHILHWEKMCDRLSLQMHNVIRFSAPARLCSMLENGYERYLNGTCFFLGIRSFISLRKDSTLLSPIIKAMIEPITIPHMPPNAMPSRNMRLRKNVIVATFSIVIYCKYTTVFASLQSRSKR